jgi:hypothetical protein
MPATWRREDIGYAAAAVCAAALLLYLVFGNFGLVPSPIATAQTEVGSYAIGAVAEISGVSGTNSITPVPESLPTVPLPPLPPPPDRTPPNVVITTEPGTSLAVADSAVVAGTVTDAGSGVKAVSVSFAAADSSDEVPAKLECTQGNRSCAWTASVPAVVGDFTVTASARDVAGNTTTSPSIEITVVNPGRPVREVVDGVGDTVKNVPDALSQVVGGLLGVLSGN